MAVAHAHARLTVSGVSEARFRRTAGDTIATSPLLCRKEMRQRLQTAVYALALVPSGIVGHVQSNLQNVAWKISLYFCQCAVMFGCGVNCSSVVSITSTMRLGHLATVKARGVCRKT